MSSPTPASNANPLWLLRSWLLFGGAVVLFFLANQSSLGRMFERPGAFEASGPAVALDRELDWSTAGLIAVQEGNRYKTLDSFARESVSHLYGKEHLPGLSPLASMFELLFNRGAYADTPIVYIKDKGLRIHFTAHLPELQRERIRQTGYMTPREFNDPVVHRRADELAPRTEMNKAVGRVRAAQFVLFGLGQKLRIVPRPQGDQTTPWLTPDQLRPSLPIEAYQAGGVDPVREMERFGEPVPDIGPTEAMHVMAPWSALWRAWRTKDALAAQAALDQLAANLPALAPPDVYPAASIRRAEARYYSLGKFTGGWTLYLLGAIAAVWALITRWRTPYIMALVLLVLGLGWHAYGVSLRWFILDRIPVGNMFEAITASAWVGVAVALIAELVHRVRVFALAGNVTGFFALIVAGYILPGGGTLQNILSILDDLMLRIHTTLIISSYALIFLASVIAVVYLFGYYLSRTPHRSVESGILTALSGAALWLVAMIAFVPAIQPASGAPLGGASGMLVRPGFPSAFGLVAVMLAVFLVIGVRKRVSGPMIVGLASLMLASLALATGSHGFANGIAWAMLLGGAAWAAATDLGFLLQSRGARSPEPVGLTPAPAMATATAGAIAIPPALQRPVMAGGSPGDERSRQTPLWLQQVDWAHLIILNMVFVMLFVGTILGAVWADYSWGRPWGWDPKEVFAMNTWIIYAILIHMRFVVANRGLWTAWLSVAGCLMMIFNWCYINFFIVGMHSYA